MAFQYSPIIENNILSYLQGWTIKPLKEAIETDEGVETEQETVEISEILETSNTEVDIEKLNLQSTKEISHCELMSFWNKTLLLVEAYLQKDLDEVEEDIIGLAVRNAIEMWCAGLIWRKYNIRVVDQEDQTNTIGYGDNLINTAKATLKPYRYSCLSIFSM